MKLSEFRNPIAKFTDFDDSYGGVITEEPGFKPDPLNDGEQMLVVVVKSSSGLSYQLNARTQMPDAIRDAVIAAGCEELEVGGHLTVTYVENRGNAKIYAAVYESPDSGAAGF